MQDSVLGCLDFLFAKDTGYDDEPFGAGDNLLHDGRDVDVGGEQGVGGRKGGVL
jgi:hypothetical protein